MAFRIEIDEACRAAIDPRTLARWEAFLIPATAAHMETGSARPIANNIGLTCYLHRLTANVLRLTLGPVTEAPIPDRQLALFHQLWDELEAGAENPQKRAELAIGMLARLPCGNCRPGWRVALRGLMPEHLETPDAFRRWVHERRQEIRAKKGLETFPIIARPPTAPS